MEMEMLRCSCCSVDVPFARELNVLLYVPLSRMRAWTLPETLHPHPHPSKPFQTLTLL